MSLYKIGSTLKILKSASSVEGLLLDKSVEASLPKVSIVSPVLEDHLFYRARAISAGDFGPMGKDGSRGWNYNGNFDYFPRKELEAAYPSFVQKQIFLDHNSSSSLYSIGKLLDSYPVEDPETGEFYIEILGKIDRTLHPEICRKIETGELNSTSMGCSVDESKCSICGHTLFSDADKRCEHLESFSLGKKFPSEIDLPEFNIHKGEMVPAFSINSGIVFNEDSIVGVPADSAAVIKSVIANMKSRLTKKASLSKEEQLDLAAQMEKLFEKLDESTKISLKAEFCGICPPVKEDNSKESSMADKNVLPNDEQKKILSKISALEMEQLESYVAHKTKKANEIVNKEVVADATSKEETFLSKIVAKVKNSFAAELLEKKIETVAKEEMNLKCKTCGESGKALNDNRLCAGCQKIKEVHDKGPWNKSISATFTEDKNNVLASTWSISQNGNILIEASLKDIWGSKFETLSFEDQKWATSEAYAKEAVSRLLSGGLPKLAYYWDVQNKITKTAANGEFFKAHDFFVPGSDSDNDWKPEDIKKSDEKDGHVATEYTFKFPGQVDSRGGLNSSGITTINMKYNFKRQEGSDFVGGSDSSNNYKPDEVKSADEGNKGGYGHVKTEYSFKRQPGKEFVGGSDSSNNMTPEEIKRASLKTASEPKLGPSGPRATPTTGLSNKKHDYLTTPKFTDPKPGVDSKGPAAPAGKDVKIEYKIDMPGQEAGQKGPAAPKPMAVKTDYSEPKPETDGKEVKTTPKNPDEKSHEKSEKEVKTDYVAEGKEHMEEEEKENKKVSSINYKQANSVIKWSAMSPEAQEFIKKHVKKHMDEDGMKQDQAVAAAYSEAREKGFDVPSKKATQETDMKKQAADKPMESVDGSTLPEGKKKFDAKPDEAVQGTTLPEEGKSASPETSAQGDKEHKTPDLTKKPTESVDGTTLPPQGKKDEESVEKSTHPDGKKEMGDESEKSVQASKTMGDKPEEAVQDKPELSKKTMGDKAEQCAQGETEPKGTDPKKAIDEAVNKSASALPCGSCGKSYDPAKGEWCEECMVKHLNKNRPVTNKEPSSLPASRASKKEAATEMPTPEMHEEEVMVDEKPTLPGEAPVAEEVSAFDKAEKLDIGEGYSAHKDKESHEVIISKDGKEVKRLPDGFGADPKVVVDLMKSVLGLPPEANNNMDMPDMTAPMGKEEPKMEEHPALEEAHEDELGIKESSLKAKEAELLKKEAALKAIEEKAQKAEASKKFASILQARSERCKQIVATMVDKDALKLDKEVYETEIKLGTYLLDAQKKAFESAINAKHKELIAMDDLALKAMEKVVEELPVQSNVNTKKANKIWASPTFNAELSEDEELAKIFKTMGNSKQRPQ